MKKPRWMSAFCVAVVLSGSFVPDVRCAETSQEHKEAIAEAWELLDEGKLKKAAKVFEKLDEATGGDEKALLGLATAHYRLERYKKSLALARSLLESTQDRSVEIGALHLLGNSLYMTERKDKASLEEAETAFRREIELLGRPSSALRPMYSLATVLQALRREHEAIEALRKVLEVASEPDHPAVDSARILICQLRRSLGYDEYQPPGLPAEGTGSTVLHVGGDVNLPVKLWAEQPAPKNQGYVLVQIIIDKEGCVTGAKVIRSSNVEAEEEAVQIFRGWVFRPATLNGEPVDVYYKLSISSRK